MTPNTFIFYYPVTLRQDTGLNAIDAPAVMTLPMVTKLRVAVLVDAEGPNTPAGMYVREQEVWRFAMPYPDFCHAIIRGDTVVVYINKALDTQAPPGSTVYQNGRKQTDLNIVHGNSVYVSRTPPASGGGGGSAVTSVNGMIGDVVINAMNLGGLALVGKTNDYNSLNNKPAPYSLPAATPTTLGGVMVPTTSAISVDGAGNIDFSVASKSTISNKIGTVVSAGSGASLIQSQSAGTLSLKSLQATGAVSVTDPGTGSLIFDVPYASAGQAGAIKVGSGLSIDASGVLSASGGGGTISLTGDVTGASATGTIATVLANSGVVAGSYAKVTVNAKGLVTAGSAMAASDVNTALGYTAYDGAANPQNFLKTNQNISISGDAAGSGTTAITLTLAASGVTAGSYAKVTVNAKGLVTAGSAMNLADVVTGLGYTPVNKAGDSLTGSLNFNNAGTVTNIIDPAADQDAANKRYVDLQIAAIASGTDWKENVKAASIGNLTLSGAQTVDGVSLVAGDRVLVKDQTDAKQNGVYIVAASAWTRSADTNTGDAIKGMAVLALGGTTQARTQWINTNATTPVVGTDNITFGMLQTAGSAYIAGTGLTLTGNQFSITNVGTAGTYTKVTTNAQGQVLTGSQLNASDVNTALGYTAYDGTANPQNFLKTNQAVTLTGDATGTGTTSIAVVLSNVGSAGTYTKVTVDAKGRVTVGAQLANADIITALGFTPINKAGDTLSGVLNWAPTVSMPAAGTTDIGGAASNSILISGSAVINALGSAPAGAERWVTFSGTPTLTYSATALILPGAADIVVQANDSANFMSLGGGNWRCIGYTRADGTSITGAPDATKLPLAGGTMSGAINYAPIATLASAATTDLATANANSVSITGSATINAFGSGVVGMERDLIFAGALTLTNSANLILPGAANIVTAAGDTATAVCTAAGVWRITSYTKANGQALIVTPDATKLPLAGGTLTGVLNFANIASVAAAATTALGTASSNAVNVTGSGVTITSLGTSANVGTLRWTTFAGANTLTHNATSLVLPGAADITTAAGDSALFEVVSANNWKCLFYQKANGQPIVGAPDATKLPLAGGTLTGAVNNAPAVTLASAATVNIGAAAANDITVSGTNNITAFDTIAAGAHRTLTFGGVLTLTNNASILLPGGANITTAAGDVAEFVSQGAGVWKCEFYTKANGQPIIAGAYQGGTLSLALNNAPAVSIAASATPAIGAAAANDISLTGSGATITAFDSIAAGAHRSVTFAGANTLTHNGTSLILPSAANISTAAGDVAEFVSLGGGNWRCEFYTRANGTAIKGDSTNATLTNPSVVGFVEAGVAPAAAASYTINLSQGTDIEVTTNANFTVTLPSPTAGKSFTLTVNYGGAHSLSFAGGTIRWQNTTVPTPTSVNGKADMYVFKSNRAGTAWFGNDGGRNF